MACPEHSNETANVKDLDAKAEEETKEELISTESSDDKAKSRKCCCNVEACELFTYLSFILYCLEVMCMPLVVSGFCLWLPQYALELGYSPGMGALLVSIQGASDMLGRLIGGIVFDHHFVRKNRRFCHTVCGLITAALVIAVGAIPNYWVVLTITAIHGLFEGTYHSQRTSVVAETIPKRLMAASVGVLIFFQGGGVFVGPLVGGAVFDILGRCRWIFVINGGIFACFCTLFLIEGLFSGKSKDDVIK